MEQKLARLITDVEEVKRRYGNGRLRVMTFSVLIVLAAVAIFFFGGSFWPVKIFEDATATAEPAHGATVFLPGCGVDWRIEFKDPIEGPVVHAVQLVVEYPGADWIVSFQEHEGSLHSQKKDGHLDYTIETGTLTLPRGKVLENRKFKIRHIYRTHILWRNIHQEVETPWYQSGAFDVFEDMRCD